jgi:ribonuclease P protein component
MAIMNTFRKNERLCGKKLITSLLESRKAFHSAPFRFAFVEATLDSLSPVQVVISVPKRNFKRAVDRNRIRRRIKEAYRVHKPVLYGYLKDRNKQLAVLLVYTAKEEQSYEEIERKIIVTLQRYIDENEKYT